MSGSTTTWPSAKQARASYLLLRGWHVVFFAEWCWSELCTSGGRNRNPKQLQVCLGTPCQPGHPRSFTLYWRSGLTALAPASTMQAQRWAPRCSTPSWPQTWPPAPSSTPTRSPRQARPWSGARTTGGGASGSSTPLGFSQSAFRVLPVSLTCGSVPHPLQDEVLALAFWHTPRGKWWPVEVRPVRGCGLGSCALLDTAEFRHRHILCTRRY